MKVIETSAPPATWDPEQTDKLIRQLATLRQAMVRRARKLAPRLDALHPCQRASAVNLAHYLALRHVDLREMQQGLALTGLSSLGRAESHVLANLDKVLGILHRLAGRPWVPLQEDEPAGFHSGPALLAQHAQALFGAQPDKRPVRIMVTLPTEAAWNDALVDQLVHTGMDIARINCAHDSAVEWEQMVQRVRGAAARLDRKVRILMDLGGPKLRTGAIAAGGPVLKIRPQRDAMGRVTAPACFALCASTEVQALPGSSPQLQVDADWLYRLKTGDRIDLTDARGARRKLTVVQCATDAVMVESGQTVYLSDETRLRLHYGAHHAKDTGLRGLPALPGELHLVRGQILHLLTKGIGHDAEPAAKGKRAQPARIACTLPMALKRMRKGERIWFDDGRIGGVVRTGGARRVVIEITEARAQGEKLAADKGINLPDTRLDLPALTQKDLEDLPVVVRLADMVGLSFAQSADDVHTLRAHLQALGAAHLGLILKIETRRGFEHLPELLLAAMEGPAAGVMIARGDLAVECGYERMAEVQEEILWACEAAHMPVVWATQVLETLARTGLPTRGEITDAAMGARAECVMLNKGPHILEAMQTLDDILRRMQAHQSKKRSLLRALKSWDVPARKSARKTTAA